MKLQLKNTPEQRELIAAWGSRNKAVSMEAAEAIAAFIGPVIQKVLLTKGTVSEIYTDSEYNEDDSPSLPLDPLYDKNVGTINVWSQATAGGLPTSHVAGLEELKVSSYRLDSAMSFDQRYAQRARLDVVSRYMQRWSEEILLKQERNGWAILLRALAEGRTNGNEHLINSTTADLFQLDDMNRLMTLIRRQNTAVGGGTPIDFGSRGLTDLYVSPEVLEDVRGFAYQPMNTRANPNTDESTAVPLPDSVREEVYRNAGTQSIYNVNLHELLELGISQKYNDLFDTFYSGNLTFVSANQELCVGFDLSREFAFRLIERNAETGATFVAQPDDQFLRRSEKIGLYGSLREGRIVTESRATSGIIIQ